VSSIWAISKPKVSGLFQSGGHRVSHVALSGSRSSPITLSVPAQKDLSLNNRWLPAVAVYPFTSELSDGSRFISIGYSKNKNHDGEASRRYDWRKGGSGQREESNSGLSARVEGRHILFLYGGSNEARRVKCGRGRANHSVSAGTRAIEAHDWSDWAVVAAGAANPNDDQRGGSGREGEHQMCYAGTLVGDLGSHLKAECYWRHQINGSLALGPAL
jgi:hypothetical protein